MASRGSWRGFHQEHQTPSNEVLVDLGAAVAQLPYNTRDREAKFTESFDGVLESANLEVIKAAHRSPNTVAFVERFIQTLQQECLDYFVVFRQQHMDHLVSEMLAYYHEERPHQSKGNDPLSASQGKSQKAEVKNEKSPPDVVSASEIQCRQRLGGLLKHYYRQAA